MPAEKPPTSNNAARIAAEVKRGRINNHIALLYYYALLNALQSTSLFPRVSPVDRINNAKNVFAVETTPGEYRISRILTKIAYQFISLGVDIPGGDMISIPRALPGDSAYQPPAQSGEA